MSTAHRNTLLLLYGLKSVRVFFIWFALYITSQIMQNMYVANVFANNVDPPSLLKFVLIFVGVEVSMLLVLLIILYLSKYMFDGLPSFPLSTQLLGLFVFDAAIVTVVLSVLGLVMASIMKKKKYFRYKTDGLRAIRALQEMMLYVGVLIAQTPFFLTKAHLW